MWICSRCKTANKDGYTQCISCSAPRNTRRFGASGTGPEEPGSPQVTSERRMQPRPEPEDAPPPRRQTPPLPVKPRPFLVFARLVGGLLSILLPLYVLALSILQFKALSPVITSLFMDAGVPSIPLFGYPLYALTVFLAMLLSAVPGLSLLSLSHLARSVRPPR